MADLAERVVRVRLLLETLNDPYPTPRGALVSDPGPAPSRYVPCETCKRRGELRMRGGWALCLVCDGRGWKRREDEPAWDAYVELPLVEAAALPREPATKLQLPEQIREETYGWERLRQTYDRHGSYKAIRVQLDWLSLVAPLRFRLVRTVLVDHEPRHLDIGMRVQLDLGVVMIARRIPHVRVPPWLIEESAAARRRDTIEALAADGFTAGQIARRLGVTKETVRRKLKRNGVAFGVAGIPGRAM
jgi:hypothetical protein